MVRVPGSSGDSGFHRESLREDVKIKIEPGMEASAEEGSPQTCEAKGSPDHQSFGRGFEDKKIKEEDQAIDLEDKPRPPPEVPSGATVDHAAKCDPLDTDPSFYNERFLSTTTLAKRKKKDSKPSRVKMKAPDSDHDVQSKKSTDHDAEKEEKGSWQLDQLEQCFYWKELKKLLSSDPVLKILKPTLIGSLTGPVSAPVTPSNQLEAIRSLMKLLEDAGYIAGSFDAQLLLECHHDQVIRAGKSLFEKLIPLTGECDCEDQAAPPGQSAPRGYHTGSSQYASAESEVESEDSIPIQRMSLGPSGADLIRERASQKNIQGRSTEVPAESGHLQSYFEAAMKKYEEDQRNFARQTARRSRIPAIPQASYVPDVEMESVGSCPGRQINNYEIPDTDLDDLRRPLVAAAGISPGDGTTTQRIRMSAIADLKEFNGRDKDEDRARSWISKVKSAFLRDQAPDQEKCLVFGDLLTGPARNWHSQLSRSTRYSWKDLLDKFLVEYGGHSMSIGRQYYQAKKRVEETPLEYLYRLNVAAIRAKIQIRDGTVTIRREHVEHFIGTLDDRGLAKQLTMLRLNDVDELEDTLRACQRMEDRQAQVPTGSSTFRQRFVPKLPPAPSKPTRAVRAIHVESASSDSDSDLSDVEVEVNHRNVCAATTMDHAKKFGDQRTRNEDPKQDEDPEHGMPKKACSHCGSKKHDDRGCWKRLTCQKCGRKGHPSDRCYYACVACGEVHESGKCPMEEFYNLIRKWYVPTKHAGMLPPKAEEMLN